MNLQRLEDQQLLSRRPRRVNSGAQITLRPLGRIAFIQMNNKQIRLYCLVFKLTFQRAPRPDDDDGHWDDSGGRRTTTTTTCFVSFVVGQMARSCYIRMLISLAGLCFWRFWGRRFGLLNRPDGSLGHLRSSNQRGATLCFLFGGKSLRVQLGAPRTKMAAFLYVYVWRASNTANEPHRWR